MTKFGSGSRSKSRVIRHNPVDEGGHRIARLGRGQECVKLQVLSIAALPFLATGLGDQVVAQEARVLRVGAALPDPPFEFMTKDGPAGFDIALMTRIAEILGREWQLVPYAGADFNGVFAGLDDRRYDCVASGTTVTPERQMIADFCAPYAVSGQSLVVDVRRHLSVHGIADLKGLVIGVQRGNTSQPVADNLVAEHRAARVRVYAYDEIAKALDDLTSGWLRRFYETRAGHGVVRARPANTQGR
jgi:ABC-type amino acid transport substrate-binding protein